MSWVRFLTAIIDVQTQCNVIEHSSFIAWTIILRNMSGYNHRCIVQQPWIACRCVVLIQISVRAPPSILRAHLKKEVLIIIVGILDDLFVWVAMVTHCLVTNLRSVSWTERVRPISEQTSIRNQYLYVNSFNKHNYNICYNNCVKLKNLFNIKQFFKDMMMFFKVTEGWTKKLI